MSELFKAMKEQARHISSLGSGLGKTDAIHSMDELAKAEQKITELQRENAELKRIMECKPVGEVEYEYAGKLRIDQRVKWADGALGNLKSGDKLYTSPPIQDGMVAVGEVVEVVTGNDAFDCIEWADKPLPEGTKLYAMIEASKEK